MITPDEALSLVLEHIKPLGAEQIPVSDSLGRIVAERVVSRRDIPIKDSSAMDGYAVKAEDISVLPAKLTVKGVIAAGDTAPYAISKGECYRIMTGAFVPQGADTVVEHECTDNGRETVSIQSAKKKGDNIRPAQDDIAKGSVLDYVGKQITPYHLSRFSSAGALYLSVYRKPRVAVISTGSEIISPADYDDTGRMIDANAPAVIGLLQEVGAECSYLGVVPDEEEPLLQMLLAVNSFDMIVISGGISAGDFDYMASISEKAGIQWKFHKVNQKPGKPVAFGHITYGNNNSVPIFGLPGNPVSCMFCTYFYIVPAAKKFQGGDFKHKPLSALLGEEVKKKEGRIQFDRVRLEVKEGTIHAFPYKSQNSNLIDSMTKSHAFMRLDNTMNGILKIGTPVYVYLFNHKELF